MITSRFIGLDLSLTATGWADDHGRGVFQAPSSFLPGWGRLAWMRDVVLTKAREGNRGLIIIEGLLYHGGWKPEILARLAELRGVVCTALYEESISWVDVPPGARALFATGNRNAKKIDVVASAQNHLTYTGVDDNEADAMWLRAMAECYYTSSLKASLKPYQLTALSEITWPQYPWLLRP